MKRFAVTLKNTSSPIMIFADNWIDLTESGPRYLVFNVNKEHSTQISAIIPQNLAAKIEEFES